MRRGGDRAWPELGIDDSHREVDVRTPIPDEHDVDRRLVRIVGRDHEARVVTRVGSYPGLYLLHCHTLEHEDDGMMLNVQIM